MTEDELQDKKLEADETLPREEAEVAAEAEAKSTAPNGKSSPRQWENGSVEKKRYFMH